LPKSGAPIVLQSSKAAGDLSEWRFTLLRLIYKELANILGAACVATCANEKPSHECYCEETFDHAKTNLSELVSAESRQEIS